MSEDSVSRKQNIDSLNELLHREKPSRIDSLLFILHLIGAPATIKEIKEMCGQVDLRIDGWNLSSILGYHKGKVIRTDKNWKITQSGKKYLNDKNIIVPTPQQKGKTGSKEPREIETDPSKAFVAMWSDPFTKEVYEQAIEPALGEMGYKPILIAEKEHNNRIDGEIEENIRKAKFVIADLTYGKKGARGSVYYEAGFAHGCEKEVIFTCHKDKFEDVHFDVDHFKRIPWEEDKLDKFKKALIRRIEQTVRQGPISVKKARKKKRTGKKK